MRHRPLVTLTAAAVLLGTGLSGAPSHGGQVAGLRPLASAAPEQVTFHYTGAEQTFVVPAQVHELRAVLIGGAGGGSQSVGIVRPGGSPARVEAVLPVTPGQVLYIEVGGNGAWGSDGGAGGFNGGGNGGAGAGGGAGGTDIRTIPRVRTYATLDSRLLVAGGGGGGAAGDGRGGAWGQGGSAAMAGYDGWSPTHIHESCTSAQGGGPGTSSAGGQGGLAALWQHHPDPPQPGYRGLPGRLGAGGDGHSAWQLAGAGGGGGHYGGGGGGGGTTNLYDTFGCYVWPAGGGGGSSYVHPTATLLSRGYAHPWDTVSPRATLTFAPGPPQEETAPVRIRVGTDSKLRDRQRPYRFRLVGTVTGLRNCSGRLTATASGTVKARTPSGVKQVKVQGSSATALARGGDRCRWQTDLMVRPARRYRQRPLSGRVEAVLALPGVTPKVSRTITLRLG